MCCCHMFSGEHYLAAKKDENNLFLSYASNIVVLQHQSATANNVKRTINILVESGIGCCINSWWACWHGQKLRETINLVVTLLLLGKVNNVASSCVPSESSIPQVWQYPSSFTKFGSWKFTKKCLPWIQSFKKYFQISWIWFEHMKIVVAMTAIIVTEVG